MLKKWGKCTEDSYLAWSSGESGYPLGLVGSQWCEDMSELTHSLKSLGWHSVGEQRAEPGMQVCGHSCTREPLVPFSTLFSTLFPSLPWWPQKPLQ